MTDNTDNEGLPGLPAAVDVSPEDIEKLNNLPLRAQQIGALLAIGFTPPDIDAAFTLPEGTARVYRNQYFARNNLSITPKTRDSIMAAYLRSKAVGLVGHITPAKSAKAGVGELAKSASMLLARAESLEGSNQVQDIGARISSALSKLAQVTSAQRDARKISDGEGARDNENEVSR